jgi:hypothetical protein
MTVLSVLDAAGRRRSPATMPGYHAGRPPRNKGMRYPADPPTVEEIVAVMRHAPDDRHGSRLRAMIVVLWRAGLRIQEALALAEHDLDYRRGSVLVRNGKGGRRREVGIDEWGWEQLRPWLDARAELPVGRPVLHYRRPDPRAAVVGFRGPLGVPPARRPRRGQAPLCAPPAASRACARACARGRAAEHHPAPARARQPRHDVDLSAGDRPRGDHHGRARTPRADDVRDRRAQALTRAMATTSGSVHRRSRSSLAKRAPRRPNPHDRASSDAGVSCPRHETLAPWDRSGLIAHSPHHAEARS